MLNPADKIRARFAPNDPVRFKYRRRIKDGTLVRTNPKRGVVLAEGQEYTVPYELLIPVAENTEDREQRIETVLQSALGLMVEHGLRKWRFRFDHSTRRAGCCNYRSKTISIAFDLATTGSDNEIRDTILHEIAHALVGKKHNHDVVWEAKAREMGCSGERTHKLLFSPPRWSVTCENHCWKHTAQRRNSNLVCRTCGGKLIYSSPRATA